LEPERDLLPLSQREPQLAAIRFARVNTPDRVQKPLHSLRRATNRPGGLFKPLPSRDAPANLERLLASQPLTLWVPKTRPGMLSRRFAPRDRIGSGAQKYDRLLSEDLLNAEFAARALDLC
jgi:hypothetical protein